MMKKIIEILLQHWYLFPLGFLLMFVPAVYLLLEPWPEYTWPSDLTTVGFLFFALMQLVVAVLCLWKRQKNRLITVVAAGAFCILAFLAVSFFGIFFAGENDHFGARHPIPAGTRYSVPADSFADLNPDSTVNDSWMMLCNDCQPGIYRLICYAPSLPDGEIYLKASEITTGTELSIRFHPVVVAQHIDFSKIIDNEKLTIYDGIWGEPYGARIEVWYKDGKTGDCRKITERVWRVEGWMR